MREEKIYIPVIMLTARDEEIDRLGLRWVLTITLPSPFSVRELMARVKAVLRRRRPNRLLQVGDAGGR